MAEELEKKPEFVVHKKQQDSNPNNPTNNGSGEKKKVVVLKRKPASGPAQSQKTAKPAADQGKKEGVRVLVKKPETPAPALEKKETNLQTSSNQPAKNNAGGNNKDKKPFIEFNAI